MLVYLSVSSPHSSHGTWQSESAQRRRRRRTRRARPTSVLRRCRLLMKYFAGGESRVM